MTHDYDNHENTDETQGDASALELEIEALRSENAALKDQAMRYAAEAENTKRRAERESNDARAFAIQRFARDLLGVADVLSRALSSAPSTITDPAFKNFVAGIDMTQKDLSGAFERNGVKKIAPLKGDKFDPHLHQAVMEQPATDVPGGAVLSILQDGYELFGRVVRPAMVAVALKSADVNDTSAKVYGADQHMNGADVDTTA
jgi:molecular chaperone GrpE